MSEYEFFVLFDYFGSFLGMGLIFALEGLMIEKLMRCSDARQAKTAMQTARMQRVS